MFLYISNAIDCRIFRLFIIFKNLTCKPQAIRQPAAKGMKKMDVTVVMEEGILSDDPVSCVSMMLPT